MHTILSQLPFRPSPISAQHPKETKTTAGKSGVAQCSLTASLHMHAEKSRTYMAFCLWRSVFGRISNAVATFVYPSYCIIVPYFPDQSSRWSRVSNACSRATWKSRLHFPLKLAYLSLWSFNFLNPALSRLLSASSYLYSLQRKPTSDQRFNP